MNAAQTVKPCSCGCGHPAPVAKRNDKRRGYVKGFPVDYIRGHQNRGNFKPPTQCLAPGCTTIVRRQRHCTMHRTRLLRHGSYDLPTKPTADELIQTFVDRDTLPGCWLWLGLRSLEGYAICGRHNNGSPQRAHIRSYELKHGPVPEGLVLDHTCHSNDSACPGGSRCPHRRCVNPDHLEPVTQRVNWLRGRSPSAAHATSECCTNGHVYAIDGYRLDNKGARVCLKCQALWNREYRERQRLEAAKS